jgi:hypothetical protein
VPAHLAGVPPDTGQPTFDAASMLERVRPVTSEVAI